MFTEFFGDPRNYPEFRQTNPKFLKLCNPSRIKKYKQYLKNFSFFQFSDSERFVIESCIDLIFKIIHFPFWIKLKDFQSESEDSDSKIFLNLPQKMSILFLDFEFLGLLFQLLLGCKNLFSIILNFYQSFFFFLHIIL